MSNLLNPESPPCLTGATIVAGTCEGQQVKDWQDLMRRCCVETAQRRGLDVLLALPVRNLNVAPGRETSKGFHDVEEVRVSVQNEEASRAFQIARDIACYAGLVLDLRVYYFIDGRSAEGRMLVDGPNWVL